MKVFLSWSGEQSKAIAEILRKWIPNVIQAVKPYYTPDDIQKGTKWNSEISAELEQSKIGIICLTKDNLNSPWIMFEAGALSKNLNDSKVVPLLFGIEPADISGPLVHFQAAKFSKSEMKKVIVMMNQELGENGLEKDNLDDCFETYWPKLEQQVVEIMKSTDSATTKVKKRTDRELLEEILSLSRDFYRYDVGDYNIPNVKVFKELMDRFDELAEFNGELDMLGGGDAMRKLYRTIEFMIKEIFIDDVLNADMLITYLKSKPYASLVRPQVIRRNTRASN